MVYPTPFTLAQFAFWSVGHVPPPNPPTAAADAWDPFDSCVEFNFTHYHFIEVQNSAPLIDKALDLWAATIAEFGKETPWSNSKELYATIDSIQQGDSPWKVYEIQYQGPHPPGTPLKWMTHTYELCTRDTCQVLHRQLVTTQFKDSINLTPYQQFDNDGQCMWSNLMSADWAWKQADEIAKDESTHGSIDKTTVSVATGHQEYHPIYMSPGNLTNIAQCACGNALLPIAFLPIPKIFCHQMYHTCLAQVFWPLKAGMTTPEVVKCPDGHFRWAIYGLGLYIADYPEQVWLAAIVQGWCPKCTLWTDFGVRADIVLFTSDFPRADIHELLSPDLLHQVIKGIFKDHIVMWVNEYLLEVHGETRGLEIIADIDHHISAVPAFPGLRCFPDGRDFTQWTGDDLKVLMKVYLAAIAGHVPSEFFVGTAGVNGDFISLPCQHSLLHYLCSIRLFGSPNGLCSSITESKHIKAVKEPWWRSSRYNALIQMLWTICRLDKLAVAWRAFEELGMIDGTTASYTAMIQAGGVPQPRAVIEAANDDNDDNDNGPSPGPKTLSTVELARLPGYPNTIEALAAHIEQPRFPGLLQHFLYDQLNPDTDIPVDDIPLHRCPVFNGQISMYHPAVARYFAPSNLCGAVVYSGDEPDEDTGMWVVRPEFYGNECQTLTVVHLDCITRAAHLLLVFGSSFVPDELHFSDSLDVYRAYFVNNNIDHHCHKFLS
ncbi:hypothetical protein BJV74DRAFT_876935 [Russula compacta]|nr:hypothetical protein BJV74DRAFT_876935 [Russula compacta]